MKNANTKPPEAPEIRSASGSKLPPDSDASYAVFSLSGVYERQTFWREPVFDPADPPALSGTGDCPVPKKPDSLSQPGISAGLTDLTSLPGANAYCDEAALSVLRAAWRDHPARLRFLDSGNYHYLSFLTAEQIREPFALVLFDNHPDTQRPAFGDILSCGGWVRYALERLPLLQRVWLIGADPDLLREEGPLPAKVHALQRREDVLRPLQSETLPLLLSIDKDVLSETDAVCNWSQGVLRLSGLLSLLDGIASGRRVLAMDVCGETIPEDAARAHAQNDACNRALRDWWYRTGCRACADPGRE